MQKRLITSKTQARHSRGCEPPRASHSRTAEPVITLVFPEAAGIFIGHIQGHDVLGVLEAKFSRHAELHWKTVLGREVLITEGERQDCLWMKGGRHVNAGMIVVGASEAHVFGTCIRLDKP